MYLNKTIFERFHSKVIDNGSCKEWSGYISSKGYGRINLSKGIENKVALAHRVAWELVHGPIPNGIFVCHKCDNRKCVNVDHLFLGTNTDNMRDASNKGRVKNQNIDKTHCNSGHPLEGKNLYLVKTNRSKTGFSRICIICKRQRLRDWRARQKQKRSEG